MNAYFNSSGRQPYRVVHCSQPALPSTLPSPPLTHTVVQECITLGNLSRHSHAHRLDKYNTHFQSSISGYYRIRHHLHRPYITTPTHTTSSPQLTPLYICVCIHHHHHENRFHYIISPPCTISSLYPMNYATSLNDKSIPYSCRYHNYFAPSPASQPQSIKYDHYNHSY